MTPVDASDNVPTSIGVVAASFSEPMAPLSGDVAFTLNCAAPCTDPTGSVSLDASGSIIRFTLTPATTLEPLSVYTATVSGARSLATGVALASAYAWRFTTGVDADTGAPAVSSTSPRSGDVGVAINTLIAASFNEAMNALTITDETMTLACPAGTPVTGTVDFAANGNVATFAPAINLPVGVTCTVAIASDVEDVSGNGMVTTFAWNFATGVATDTTAPVIRLTTPLADDSDVAINTLITASFSEPMDPLTITDAHFVLACPAGTPVAGAVGYAVNGSVATLTPASDLPASTTCTAQITTGAEDVAGNALAIAVNWSFTTGAAPDVAAPTVSSTSPAGNDTGVAINTLITASFSEPMDPLTVTTASFTLACPADNPIAGSVGYAVNGSVATFTPLADLPAGVLCAATVTNAVEDVAGNTLASPFSWTFTTGAAPDTTAPAVSATDPVDTAADVAINTLITASFSEPMDPLTITAAHFVLACPAGTPVAGAVGYAVNGSVATLTPASDLPASTTCTAQITTGAEDVAGNALAIAVNWSFTTGAAPDVAAPTVSSTSPAGNDTGVAINTLITASFSEPMDPLTVTTASFTLACPADNPIAGSVGYAVNGSVATFTAGRSPGRCALRRHRHERCRRRCGEHPRQSLQLDLHDGSGARCHRADGEFDESGRQ
ncbi:MAG: Ig-like domain-containing protein [Proteobacteria bacterium]|nr:Ig-like domain-containing protein [Pseudomonadota bacterium]